MDRWAYEKVKDGETVAYHVIEIGEDGKVETAYKCADESRLAYMLRAFKWFDAFSEGFVSIPEGKSKTKLKDFDIVFEPPPKARTKATRKKGA